VNPGAGEILGRKAYASLAEIPEALSIDACLIFRRGEAVGPIVDEAIKRPVKTVWMQEGLAHNQAAAKARGAGLQVVMSKCILKEHRRMRA